MYNTSKCYKEKVLEASTQHELNIYIDGNKIEPNHIIDFSSKSELFNNNEFCLGCTPEKDIEFEIDKRDLPETYEEVYVETGVKYHEDIVTEGENITLKEEKEIPLNLEISGNSKQETREGKENICNIKSIFNGNGNVIKATYNTDRSMTFEKIADINAIHFGFILKDTTTQNISLYMKYKIETSKESCTIGTRLDNGFFTDSTALDITGNISEITWTGKSAGKNISSLAFSSSNLNLGDKITVYSIYAVLGDTFEPIVPSLDYRSEIKCCGDNVNELDFTNYQEIVANNTYIAIKANKFNLKANKEYIYSYNAGGDFSKGNDIKLWFRDSNNTSYKEVKTNTIFTLTEAELNKLSYIQVVIQGLTSGQSYKGYIYPKIEKGTIATEYSKYGQGCITEVISNKNLFDIVGLAKNRNWTLPYTETKNGITITINKNGSITISGTATSNIQYYLFGSYRNTTEIDFNIPLEKNKTYISSGGASNWNTGCQFILYDYDGTNRRTFNFYNNTLTMDKERFKPTAFEIAIQSGTTVNQTYYLQIEENSEPTAYEEHKEQKYIIPTQQEMLEGDCFDFDNEEEVHTWNKIVFNGTEDFDNITIDELNVFVCKTVEMDYKYINDDICNYKCNLFKAIKVNKRYLDNTLYINGGKKIAITSNNFTSVAELQSYLTEQYNTGTPVIIYYQLETPIRLSFTDEQKAVAKELKNAKTYDKITHIYSPDSIAPLLKTTCGSEIVPIGYFTIQKPIEDDEFKVKIKATDYMKKFEDNKYDGSNLIYPETMLEVLKDICNKVGVELGSTSFLNSEKQIAVYDNTVTARTYLGYIAEQAGGFAIIGRDGKLYIKKFGEDIIDFDIDLFGDFTWGDKFKVSKVSYEDGIQNYKFGDETQATVFIDQNNMYIVDNKQVENIYNQIKNFEIYTFEGETIIDPSYDIGDILVIDGKKVLYQGEIKYAGKFKASINNKIQAKTEQESMQTKQTNSNKIKRVQSEINQIDGKITQLVKETTENEEKITQAQQDIDGFSQKVATKDELTEKVNELKQTIDGITAQTKETGGNNIFFYAKEYWHGSTQNSNATLEEYTNTLIQQNNVSDEGYLINNGISVQSQVVKNGQYVISFNYYKLKSDATGYIKVNDIEYKLDGNVNTWNEKIIPITVTSNNIKIELGSDTVASYYISDLMVTTGTEKSIWTQNPNETRTDTVEIGKGLKIKSSTKNTELKADADGVRVVSTNTNKIVSEFTDKGMETDEIIVREKAQISSLLIQEVNGQVWITGIGG